MALKCSDLYLSQFRLTSPHLLASGDGTKSATIVGDVYVHPSAKVHPTAKIGPNVSISANVRIAAGVRLISCIILDDVDIKLQKERDLHSVGRRGLMVESVGINLGQCEMGVDVRFDSAATTQNNMQR
ncbi:mannose-1-phosphate guanylyltransferase [Sarracenia purpurea var. burkii]